MRRWSALVAGLLFGGEVHTVSVGVAWLGAALVAVVSHRGPRVGGLGQVTTWLLLGAGWASLVVSPPPRFGESEWPCHIEGTLAEATAGRSEGCTLTLASARLDGQVSMETSLSVVFERGVCTTLAPGARLELRGVLRRRALSRNPRPGLKRPARWYVVATGSARALAPPRGVGLAGWGRRFKEALRFEDARATSIYRALLLGDRRGLTPAMREPFIDTGTAHLLAISGLHLAVVGWLFFRLALGCLLMIPALAQAGRPRAWAAGLTLAWVLGYLLLIQPTDATLRAAVCLALILVGVLLSRRADAGHLLRTAAVAILAVDPTAAWGPSFQLSFAAAAAIVLVWPHVRWASTQLAEPGRLRPGWLPLARALLGAWAISAVTTMATTPLGLAWFGQRALAGAAISVVAVPWMGVVVLPLGLLHGVSTALCPDLGPWLAPVASGGLELLLDGLDGWAQVLGSSHAAAWPWSAGIMGAASVLSWLHRPTRWRRTTILVAATALQWASAGPSPGALQITMLDVGHGDAMVFQLPEGAAMMVDTGGVRWRGERQNERLAEQVLVPALRALGVARLDLLVITHADADHMGAALRLAQRVPIASLWLPPCAAERPAMARLVRRVVGEGGQVVVVSRASPMAWAGVRLEVLWPPEGIEGPDGRCLRTSNDGGLVLSMSYGGRRALLTADTGHRVEAELVRRHPRGLAADLLKVPHHGSRSSSSTSFLQVVQPEVALLSGALRAGGRGARMPPHEEVLGRYRRLGVPLWFTGRSGSLRAVIDASGGLQVRSLGGR